MIEYYHNWTYNLLTYDKLWCNSVTECNIYYTVDNTF